jgi:hypothetical protein
VTHAHTCPRPLPTPSLTSLLTGRHDTTCSIHTGREGGGWKEGDAALYFELEGVSASRS